ncbi:MAG: 2-C-methyl-D-erythritol 4-phosphate cytidylyltransferase [Proteobacteria bacterium]|nr:MAG: 2-C-methyl-D-erythritol 4-phosphate cytidylyltransferase [Pseudomonadota bacterium]
MALDALLASPYISKVVVVLAPGMQTEIEAIGATGRVLLAEGGETRQASVRNALKRIEQGEGIKPDFIVIHDAARCLVSSALIERCILAAFEWQAVTAAVPIIDTVNRCSQEGILTEAIQRDGLVAIQTPQVFSFDLLWKAHQQGDAGATDDASLVSKLAPVRVVPGDRSNIKITYPEDLQEAHRLRS